MTVESANLAPVKGRHPEHRAQKAHRNIGRELTQKDVGKMMVRTYPSLMQTGKYNWNHIPYNSSSESVNRAAIRILAVGEHSVAVSSNGLQVFLGNAFVDRNWLTVSEYLDKTRYR